MSGEIAGYRGSQDPIEDATEILEKFGIPYCLLVATDYGVQVIWNDQDIESEDTRDGSTTHMLVQLRKALDDAIKKNGYE